MDSVLAMGNGENSTGNEITIQGGTGQLWWYTSIDSGGTGMESTALAVR